MSKGLGLAIASLLFLGLCYYCAFVHSAAPTVAAPAVVTNTVTAPAVAPTLAPVAAKLQTDLNSQIVGKTIEFDTASDVIRPSGKVILDQVSKVLQSSTAAANVEVGGHTDSRGKPEANMSLSERRANAVMKYLTTKGVGTSSLSAKGYGDTKPIAENTTPAGQLKNRRIEFSVAAK